MKTTASSRMTFDFKDAAIRDIVRTISIGYGLNIIIDKEVDAKVTVHLTDVPVLEGLRTILNANGLALVQDGGIYRITQARDKGTTAINVARSDRLTINVDNVEITDFVKDISAKTGINIIAEKEVKGRISGVLRDVDPVDGLRTLLEANGYSARYRGDVLIVSALEEEGRGRDARSSGRKRLEVRVKENRVSLDLKGSDLGDALKEIADQSNLNMVTYGSVRGEVNAKLDDMPIEKAIGLLVSGTQFTFAIKDNILLVGDRNTATPSGQALSMAELIHLKHIKAEGLPSLLPKNIPAGNVQVIKEQNAVLVTGTSDVIEQVREFINQVDLPTPQIMIEAVVVEFVKDLGTEIGVHAGNGGRAADSIESFIPGFSFAVGARTLNKRLPDEISGFKFGTLGFLPDDFMVRLRALETDKKASILAQPRIATLNGNKAAINVGVTSYFRLTGGSVDNPITRFQTINSGIKLDITPWISNSGQVTAEISPEISNSVGINQEGFPDVSTRTVTTTVRLNDGETIIIGGLIRSEDKSTVDKVPLLGDIPFLGRLFQSRVKQKASSELVIYITPHILTREDSVDLKTEILKFDERTGSENKLQEKEETEDLREPGMNK